MATISIDGTDLTIDVQGLDKLWTFKSRLTIPMAHVRGATADPSIAREYKGWRGPGTPFLASSSPGPFTRRARRSFGTSTTRTRPS